MGTWSFVLKAGSIEAPDTIPMHINKGISISRFTKCLAILELKWPGLL